MASPAKIAFCANSTWSILQFRGGVIKSLLAEGYEVHVLSPPDHTVAQLKLIGCIYHPLKLSAKGKNPLQELRSWLALYRLYQQINPKMVFLYTVKLNLYGSVAAHLAGVPSIAIITGMGYLLTHRSWASWLAIHLYRYALRFPRAIWFLNEEDWAYFVSMRFASVNKCQLLSSEGVDLNYFEKSPLPTHSYPEEFRFLLIGRLLWDKGIDEYVEAARLLKANHPKVRCQLLGPAGVDDPRAIPFAKLTQWRQEGLIEYLGELDDVRPAIAAADCVVLPSYREGVPRSLLEAAAMGRPLIATRVPGCKEVVEDGINGFLCAARSPAHLTGKMAAMLNLSRAARQQMSDASRNKAEREFDEQVVIQRYLHAIHAIVTLAT